MLQLQSKLIKFICQLWIYLIKFFGFWPYYFEASSKTLKINSNYLFYPIIFFITICVSFGFFIGNLIENNNQLKNNQNQSAFFFGLLFSSIWAITFFIIYIVQYLNYRNLKTLIVNGYKLYKQLQLKLILTESDDIFIRKLLFCFCRFFILNIITIYVNIKMLPIISNRKDTIFIDFIGFWGSLVPLWVTTIYPDFFLSCIWATSYFFKQINCEISKIINDANRIKSNGINNFLSMTKYCELSDQLDELCGLHSELCEIIEQLCRFCSLHLLGWIVNSFAAVIYKTFILYILVKIYVRYENFNIFWMFLYNFIHILAINAKFLLLAFICYIARNEVF